MWREVTCSTPRWKWAGTKARSSWNFLSPRPSSTSRTSRSQNIETGCLRRDTALAPLFLDVARRLRRCFRLRIDRKLSRLQLRKTTGRHPFDRARIRASTEGELTHDLFG